MKSKKGFLLAEETLKIVIALICIGFLVYFLASLYFNSKGDNGLELAKASLQNLISEADSGQGTANVEIYNPSGWFITSWVSGNLPNSCSMEWENCLCICNGDTKDKCDKEGVCLESSYTVGNPIEIKKPLPVKLNINEGAITKNEP